ncbi:hypothetical protein MRB53_006590 [Persea americana]|uniref:Uncharacterized protein n=1 Tax=Persea americana TaxID=3435 RepID=A0ACC2MGL1_PERAE|nr:hypothetical protein MRB53_006590 [Persea americana]
MFNLREGIRHRNDDDGYGRRRWMMLETVAMNIEMQYCDTIDNETLLVFGDDSWVMVVQGLGEVGASDLEKKKIVDEWGLEGAAVRSRLIVWNDMGIDL